MARTAPHSTTAPDLVATVPVSYHRPTHTPPAWRWIVRGGGGTDSGGGGGGGPPGSESVCSTWTAPTSIAVETAMRTNSRVHVRSIIGLRSTPSFARMTIRTAD